MEKALKALEFVADCAYVARSFREQVEAALVVAASLTVIALVAREDLQRLLEEIRCESRLLPPQRASEQMSMARHFRDLVMEVKEARAFIDCSRAFWAKIVTFAVDAGKRDEDARRAAKGSYAGGRQLATKGRRVHRRQGDKFAGKATGKRLASVVAGGGGAAGAVGWR